MRFCEAALHEPAKEVVAMADAYFFPPYQPSLYKMPRTLGAGTRGSPPVKLQLPARQARLVVYNKKTNETAVYIVELLEVHAAARGGAHRGKLVSKEVVPDVQPPMVSMGCRVLDPVERRLGWLAIIPQFY